MIKVWFESLFVIVGNILSSPIPYFDSDSNINDCLMARYKAIVKKILQFLIYCMVQYDFFIWPTEIQTAVFKNICNIGESK